MEKHKCEFTCEFAGLEEIRLELKCNSFNKPLNCLIYISKDKLLYNLGLFPDDMGFYSTVIMMMFNVILNKAFKDALRYAMNNMMDNDEFKYQIKEYLFEDNPLYMNNFNSNYFYEEDFSNALIKFAEYSELLKKRGE